MSAGRLDITLEQGTTFNLSVTCFNSAKTTIDITGGTVSARIADGQGGTHLYSFTSSIPVGTDGVINLSASSSDTAAMTFFKGWWNLDITLSGVVTRVLEGDATLSRSAP